MGAPFPFHRWQYPREQQNNTKPITTPFPYMGIHGNTFGNTWVYSQGLWEYMGIHWEYTCRNSLQYIGLYKGV